MIKEYRSKIERSLIVFYLSNRARIFISEIAKRVSRTGSEVRDSRRFKKIIGTFRIGTRIVLPDVYVRVCSNGNGCITVNACPLLDDLMQPSRKPWLERERKREREGRELRGKGGGGRNGKIGKRREVIAGRRNDGREDGLKHFYSFFVSPLSRAVA